MPMRDDCYQCGGYGCHWCLSNEALRERLPPPRLPKQDEATCLACGTQHQDEQAEFVGWHGQCAVCLTDLTA